VFIVQNPTEAASFMSKRFNQVDTSVAVDALKNMIGENIIPTSMGISQNGWNTAILLRKDVGDIMKPAPYELYVENRYAKSADRIK
jgi:hypothetical protein